MVNVPIIVKNLLPAGYHLFVEADLCGHVSVLLIDTGASKTVIGKSFLKDNCENIFIESSFQRTTGLQSSSETSEFASIPILKFGSLQIQNYKVAVLDLSHVNQAYKMAGMESIDGILGSDLLVEYGAVISFPEKLLMLNRVPS